MFIGANDGASGTALLMDLGREMPQLHSKYGVDFVFFDAEEFIFERARSILPRLGVFSPTVIRTESTAPTIIAGGCCWT